MSGLSCYGNIPWFFFAFGGITGCDSASLKLCVCDADYPWSQVQQILADVTLTKADKCSLQWEQGGCVKKYPVAR